MAQLVMFSNLGLVGRWAAGGVYADGSDESDATIGD